MIIARAVDRKKKKRNQVRSSDSAQLPGGAGPGPGMIGPGRCHGSGPAPPVDSPVRDRTVRYRTPGPAAAGPGGPGAPSGRAR
eukprot:648336-Hanusia_phi.AAC.1